jgi:transcriptional regulator with XRE-family HTH domain
MEQTVNERVKLLRSTLKLSQNEFAAKTGMSAPGLWKLEAGESKPRTSTLVAICSAFGVSKEWLLHGKGELEILEPGAQPEKSSWKEKAYEAIEKRADHLEKEVEFLRKLLINVTGSPDANFLNAFDLAGLLPGQKVVKSVRAAA